MPEPPLELAHSTWPEARRLADPAAVALWPVGSVEAHGPHLPLATDSFIAREVALRAAPRLAALGYVPLVLPELGYGITRYAGEFAGTLGLSRETLRAVILDVGAAAARHGLRRLCLVNDHLEPAQLEALEEAALAITALAAIAPNPCRRRWALTLSEEFQRGACHAGRYETSLMMAALPAAVRRAIAEGLAEVPIDLAKAMRAGVQTFGEAGAKDAYFGAPAEATAGEGDELYERLVAMTVTEITEKLPL